MVLGTIVSMMPVSAACASRPSFEAFRHLYPVPLSVHTAQSRTFMRSHVKLSKSHVCQATPRDKSSPGDLGNFDLSLFLEAKVDSVKAADPSGHLIFLRIMEYQDHSLLPVYIGDFEWSALAQQINKQQTVRPMTHDLMKDSLALLGFRVTKVCVTALVNRTYHARIHYAAAGDADGELDIDARPSDAINLALRFGAPIYVAKTVAAQMARPAEEFQVKETVTEIERSCRADLAHFPDPIVPLQLQLQLAITAERYSEAARLRNQIDNMLARDRALSLVVAIETALEDKRFEEAQRLRDELRRLKAARLARETQDA